MSEVVFETSQSTAKLDAALAKAQGEIEAAAKDKVNPAFRSKYADLTAVWAAIRPALSKNGVAVTQWPAHSNDSRLHLITRLAHDGEWIKCEFSIPVDKSNSHGYGSAVTYAKRFALAAAVGVVADEDDDGNAAAKAAPKSKMDLSVQEPENRGPGEPFSEIEGQVGRPKYKNGKATAPSEYLFIQASMRAQRTEEDLLAWGDADENKKAIAALPAEWVQNVRDEFKDRLHDLRRAA
jgi:hypothetical protein